MKYKELKPIHVLISRDSSTMWVLLERSSDDNVRWLNLTTGGAFLVFSQFNDDEISLDHFDMVGEQ